jgi:hypothetical protein
MSWIRLHKDEPGYFVIKMGDHPLELPPKRRDWHLTSLQSGAVLLLAMGALTALVIWLIERGYEYGKIEERLASQSPCRIDL